MSRLYIPRYKRLFFSYKFKVEISTFLRDNNIDIALGSETHLSPSINNSEFLPDTYTAYRYDRNDGYGGAIIIAKKSLITEELKNENNCEMVAVKVQSFSKPVVLISCYRAPKKVPSDPLFNEIARITLKYKQNPVWIGGDFNLPDIDWQTKAGR